jgi:hypothetical protein
MSSADLHDQIALALATELGFDCRKRDYSQSRYVWSRDNSGAQSPPVPNDWTQNPCGEIPLSYELYITIRGNELQINNPGFKFDLGDPHLLDKLKDEFGDLDQLRDKIRTAGNNHIAMSTYNRRLGIVPKT